MKRKIVALLMISIMVLTVFSAVAVTTTQKAEAYVPKSPTPTKIKPIVLDYKPGTKYIFKSNRFNLDEVYYKPLIGTPNHLEIAKDGAAVAWLSTSPMQAGHSQAREAMVFKLNLRGTDLDKIADKQVKVTMYISYYLGAKGDAYASGRAGGAYGNMAKWGVEVGAFEGPYNDPPKSGIEVVTMQSYFGQQGFFHELPAGVGPTYGPAGIYGTIWTGTSVYGGVGGEEGGPGQGQGIASVFCSAVVIEFL